MDSDRQYTWDNATPSESVKKYQQIKYTPDGIKDYYDTLMTELSKREIDLRSRSMSNAWSRRVRASKDAEKSIFDLLQIRDAVVSLLKIHGVPQNTTIELACLGALGSGAASFHDIGKWKKPYMMLDAGVYEQCPEDQVMDVYCGIGLHEASHLNHTRLLFEDLTRNNYEELYKLWRGLLEDERIEQKVREESPGFAPYLQMAKRALFEATEFGGGVRSWHDPKMELSDIDRLNLIVFAFLRCPHLIDESMKQWRTVTNRNPFAELRGLLTTLPKDEATVKRYAQLIYDWYKGHLKGLEDLLGSNDPVEDAQEKFEKDPPPPPPGPSQGIPGASGPGVPASGPAPPGSAEPSSGTSEGPSSDEGPPPDMGKPSESPTAAPNAPKGSDDSTPAQPPQDAPDDGQEALGGRTESGTPDGVTSGIPSADEIEKRPNRQVQRDLEDKTFENRKADLDKKLADETNKLRNYKTLNKVAEVQKNGDDSTAAKEAAKAEANLEKIKKQLEQMQEKRKEQGRFGLAELLEMVRRGEVIAMPLSKAQSDQLSKVVEERIRMADDWHPDKETVPAKTVISHPVSTKNTERKFKEYYDSVKNEVAAMRSVFKFRLGKRTHRITEMREGKFNRRMLGRAMQTDRLFFQENSKTDAGVAIGILLDESGSMSRCPGSPSGNKASRALQVAVLMAKALEKVPGVELEVFSHTTNYSDITTFKYLYGKDNPAMDSMANYAPGNSNFDYCAIVAAAEILRKNTVNENKILLVVSDGAPCGLYQWRVDAFTATKNAVDQTRRSGIKVVQIAIDDFKKSEEMYGDKYVIHFTDLKTFIKDMRKMVVRLVLSGGK